MYSPMRLRAALLPVALLAVGLLIAGCGIFSPDETKDPPVDPGGGDFVPATTPDLAMEMFEKAWEAMNFAEYSKLVATEFQFFFDPNDNLEEFIGGPSWQVGQELASVEAMFSNQGGRDPVTDEPIPPILNIQFELFQPLDPGWQPPGDGDLYLDTIRQRFQVSIRVTYQGEELTTRVRGENWFYVTPVEEDGQTLWKIKVWEDKGQGAT